MQIIGGKHKKRRLVGPKGDATRPSASMLRETLFNLCQWEIEGAEFLDLFAGAGAVGLEALSRGAKFSTFVEKNRQAIKTIESNIAALKEEANALILCMDVFAALAFLEKKQASFDLIFADPPYGEGLSEQVLQWVDAHPALLKKEGSLFLEDTKQGPVFTPTHLALVSERRCGRAYLRHYRKVFFSPTNLSSE